MRICSVVECNRKHYGRTYCNMHWLRYRRYGDPHYAGPRIQTGCLVDKCEGVYYAKDLCKKHYQRWQNHGDPAIDGRLEDNPEWCQVEGCFNRQHRRDYCSTHYNKLLKYGNFHYDGRVAKRGSDASLTCIVDGCDEKHHSRGYCSWHYVRWQKHGDPLLSPNKKGCWSRGCWQWVYSGRLCKRHHDCVTYDVVDSVCAVGHCQSGVYCYGLCTTHYHQLRGFNIPVVTYEQMLIEQCWGCAICGNVDNQLYVDHDRSCCSNDSTTKKSCGYCVRGLLCISCNFGLGYMRDNRQSLIEAVSYLKQAYLQTDGRESEAGYTFTGIVCRVSDCKNSPYRTGLCRSHYDPCVAYNMSAQDYQNIMDVQDDSCAICRQMFDNSKYKRPYVDHDHACCLGRDKVQRTCGGCIRGFLCILCNRGLSSFQDDTALLKQAAVYVDQPYIVNDYGCSCA